MSTLKIILLFLFMTPLATKAQSISCQKLFDIVVENYESRDEVTCFNSSMLVKASYYRLEGTGFVIGYLKSNDYDFSGTPYIFCGISSQQWSSFKVGGMSGSWGESFHQYVFDYTCDCY